MPKETIDYSNTIIYKIYCKDETIKDIYVGHTTNFTQRKYSHKIELNNLNNTQKIYNRIRSNGGWENWDMVEIAKYCCKDATEARIKEQFHYEELKSSLNSVPPYVDKTLYFCSKCNIQCPTPKQYNMHILSDKHITKMNQHDMIDNAEKVMPFVCMSCDYKCLKKSSWNQHILSYKHDKATNGIMPGTKKYICDKCNTNFNHHSSYCRHKKKCIAEKIPLELNNISENNSISDKDLIIMLLKQNTEFMEQNTKLMEQNTKLMDMLKNNNY
jgi:hypothetical protein